MEWTPVCTATCSLILTILSLVQCKDVKSVTTSLELQCPPCEKIHCTPKRAKRLRCKGGVTRGICNCCPVCAKTENEACGGEWNYLGRCDRGLFCLPNMDQLEIKAKNPEGICKKVPGAQSDQAIPAYCFPKCAPDYCRNNPRAICAAVDNADKKQDCQGNCQHTSCRACRFVKEEPDCPKCRKDDFSCMKQFARCVRKEYCSRETFPCKKSAIDDEKGTTSKFKCYVPDCA